MTHIDVQTLTLLGWLVPLAVGLVTKKLANAGVKAVTNLALSAIIGGLAAATQTHGDVVLKVWLVNIIATFGQSIISYYGLWKPTAAADLVQNATATFGLGPSPEPATGRVSPTGLSYEDLRTIQPRTGDPEGLTEEQAALAAKRDAEADEYWNRVHRGEVDPRPSAPLNRTPQEATEPESAAEVPEATGAGTLSYEEARAVVDGKMTNGSQPIVRSDPKTTGDGEVRDHDLEEAEKYGLTVSDVAKPEPAKTAAKTTKKAAAKKVPAKKATAARKAAKKRDSA